MESETVIHPIDPEAILDSAFLTRQWRVQSEIAAQVIQERDTRIQALEGQVRIHKEDVEYFRRQANDARDYRRNLFDTQRLRRLTNDDLLDTLWKLFGPYNYNLSEKIPAIKVYRELSGLGLKETKDLIDSDWDRRMTEMNDKDLEKFRAPNQQAEEPEYVGSPAQEEDHI